MADSVLDEIVDTLRTSGLEYFPQRAELKSVRVVGHTPKPEHYTYEIVMDFSDGTERANAKIYRSHKSGTQAPRDLAKKRIPQSEVCRSGSAGASPLGSTQAIGRFQRPWRGTEHQDKRPAFARHHHEGRLAP